MAVQPRSDDEERVERYRQASNARALSVLLDHGASLESKDREGFTLLMQAVLSMEAPPARDRMVEWLLSKGVDPNAKNDRGDTAYQLAARVGIASTLDLLVKAGAKEVKEDWPKPAGGAPSAEAAVKKIIPLIEMSGEPVFKSRGLRFLPQQFTPGNDGRAGAQERIRRQRGAGQEGTGFRHRDGHACS